MSGPRAGRPGSPQAWKTGTGTVFALSSPRCYGGRARSGAPSPSQPGCPAQCKASSPPDPPPLRGDGSRGPPRAGEAGSARATAGGRGAGASARSPRALPRAAAPSQGSRTRSPQRSTGWAAGRDPPLPTGRPRLESGAKPWGQLAQGRAGGWTPAAGPGCRRGVRLRRKWVCVHAYLSAGERGYGWPGAELPGSVLPSVLSELALL